MLKGKLLGQYIICEMVTTEKKMTVRKCRTINRYVNVGHINTLSEASQAHKQPRQSSLCRLVGEPPPKKTRNDQWGEKHESRYTAARKLNPLILPTDKFSSRKCPIVSDHLLVSDRKRIITSLRGRRTDMPFRLGRECRSLIESLRNNFVLCLSFMFKSRARFVGKDSERTVLWSALSRGGSYCKYGSISSSVRKKNKNNLQNALKVHLWLKTDRGHSFIHSSINSFMFPTQKLVVFHPDSKLTVYELAKTLCFHTTVITSFPSISLFPLRLLRSVLWTVVLDFSHTATSQWPLTPTHNLE